MVNAGWLGSAFGILANLLPASQRDQIVVIKQPEDLHKLIDPANIPKCYGGSDTKGWGESKEELQLRELVKAGLDGKAVALLGRGREVPEVRAELGAPPETGRVRSPSEAASPYQAEPEVKSPASAPHRRSRSFLGLGGQPRAGSFLNRERGRSGSFKEWRAGSFWKGPRCFR